MNSTFTDEVVLTPAAPTPHVRRIFKGQRTSLSYYRILVAAFGHQDPQDDIGE